MPEHIPPLPIVPSPQNYALWTDRLVAALIDFGISVAVAIVLYLVFGGLLSGILAILGAIGGQSGAGALGAGLGCVGCITALLLPAIGNFLFGLYNKVYLAGTRGSSIGQQFQNLRIVTPTGTLVPMQTLVIRLVVQTIFIVVPFLPLLDILWPLWDDKRQTLHDKVVDTYVVTVERPLPESARPF